MEQNEFAKWIEKITQYQDSQDLIDAKAKYEKLTGQIFQDDKSYESRMGFFLEWYTLAHPMASSGLPPIQTHLKDNESSIYQIDRKILEQLINSHHGIFQVIKQRSDEFIVENLLDEKEFKIQKRHSMLPFNKNDVFEARMIWIEEGYVTTENYIYHPQETFKFIKSKTKVLRTHEKEIKKQFNVLKKQEDAIKKQLNSKNARLEKLNHKIENTQKLEKRNQLEQGKQELENERNEIQRTMNDLQDAIKKFVDEKINGELPKQKFELIQRLSSMSLKWERSRQIDIHDIYRD